MSAAVLSKEALFSSLAAGHAAGIVVVTPNRRLAQELAREFDDGRVAAGLKVWDAADILPLGALVARLYQDAQYSGLAPRLPLLLTTAQEQLLWEAAIRDSRWGGALLAVPQAAADCRRAWELAHGWRIAGAIANFPGNDDAQAFAEWSRTYARRCERACSTDTARLADVVAPLLAGSAPRKLKLVVTYAFDVMTPQQEELLGACEKAGIEWRSCAPEPVASAAGRRVFPSAREELDAAAQWARERLEQASVAPAEAGAQSLGSRPPIDSLGGKLRGNDIRIGVVVPDLGQRRTEVVRVFSRVMRPDFNLPGRARSALPFNVSLGAPFTQYPLVRAAQSILELAAGEIAFEQASRLVRSPFIGGAQAEMAKRALLDAALRKRAPARITLGKLIGLVEGAPDLRRRLEALFSVPRIESASPHHWRRHFTALLDAAGFPERSLDSDEFQARAKWNETLAEFARLERVAPKLSFNQALAQLRRLCADTPFQPETPDAPVQVLGVLESAGLEFDCLWVSGLTDEAWPLHAQPNPFIPPALQKKAGIPEASPEATLARAKRITAGWFGAAPEVVVSHPVREKDRDLIASSLISGIAVVPTEEAMRYPKYRDVIFSARRLESVEDGQAPPLATKTPRGGTRILSDQSACPFRAFARHRLAAEALEEPVDGPDARARGLLLHTLMKELWTELKGSSGLDADAGPAIERAAKAAVAQAELEEPFAGLERKRLAKLAREWLEVERERPQFEVVAMEDKRKLLVAGLELNGRIDRVDRLESGGHAVIDYKTGKATPNDWLKERPNDPQLPLYALNAKEDVSAVAFAKLKTGEMRYMGFSERKDQIPKVKVAQDWPALLAGWRTELETLGSGFAAGDARVDPKKGLATCRYCDLQPLCRVYERVDALGEGGEEAE